MQYGLIGEKLGHSYSVDIHNLIGGYDYRLTEIPRNGLDRLMKDRAFCGLNVTIPYKRAVIPYLDWIDPNAKAIGAVNTIVNRDGRLYGYNTDFIGLGRMIRRNGIALEGKKVLVLGTGGTSHTARAVAKDLGASMIVVVGRHPKGDEVSYDEAACIHSDANVIINATPCGMSPNTNESPIDLSAFKSLEAVVDVVYNPLRTRLVQSAQSMGITACGGLFMLVQQAIAASELFFDKAIDPEKAEAIYKTILAEKRNIVLVGMPGCGKSTVGRILSQKLGMAFVDTDQIITERTGRHPSSIITEDGEAFFRDIESEVLRNICSHGGRIVSTGGGATLRQYNVACMKENGVVFFIDRRLEDIKPTDDRPLTSSQEKLLSVYKERYPIYCKAADVHLEGKASAEGFADLVMEAL